MAISWPGHINDPGGIRNQFHHIPNLARATDVRYWHFSDIPPALTNVRYRG
jgi:hypothetical protein